MHTRTVAEPAAIHLRRHYPATPEAVWRAWTDPQALSAWFGPTGPGSLTRAELDVQVGGTFCLAFRMPDGSVNQVGGVYQVVEPHRRLVFSWAWHSTPDRVSRVTLEFDAVPGGCDFALIHDRFFDEAARANHARGWPSFMDRLHGWLTAAA